MSNNEAMIVKKLEVGSFLSNCFIVGSKETRKGMIIDPGADADLILNTVRKLGLSIVLIVATHIHIDHVSALVQVKEATQADYVAHEAEDFLRNSPEFNRSLRSIMGGLPGSIPKPDRLVRDGDVIEVGNLQFTVLHTPGHSPEGICLQGQGVVFCGDTLFNLSIGRTDFPGCSHTQLMNSINTRLMNLPDETKVFCGHGPETTIGFERQRNPFVRGIY